MSLTIMVLFLLACATRAGDWSDWRGPTGMGITDARDLPLTWGGEDGANIIWTAQLPGTDGKAQLDHNQSSPIVWKDRVFLIMVYRPEGVAPSEFPEHHVACYRTEDGQPVWDIKVPPGPWLLKDLRGGYSAPTPCTDGERIYALFGFSELVVLDMQGNLVWRKEITPYAWDVAIGTSPILYQDTVLVLADGAMPKHPRLTAFDRKSGDIVWEQPRLTVSFNHSTLVLVDVQDQPQLLVSASNAVQGLSPADGKVIWWASNSGDVPTPVFGGGLVYSEGGRGGPGIAVDPAGEGDVTKTWIKWKTTPVPEGYSSPVVVGDYVYRVYSPAIFSVGNWTTANRSTRDGYRPASIGRSARS